MRLMFVAIAACCAGVIGYVFADLRKRPWPDRSGQPAAPQPPAPQVSPDHHHPPPAPPNERLVRGLIGAFDISAEESVRAHVEQALNGVGVEIVAPSRGTVFDPHVHQCVDTSPAAGAEEDNRIAGIVRPGWRSRDGYEFRQPQVVVGKVNQ